MITKTEMLEGADLIHKEMVAVLRSWVKNEYFNLRDFINNPSTHVHNQKFVIVDFDKLLERAGLLEVAELYLMVIEEYKKGNPDYNRSMYENAIDKIPSSLFARLLSWMEGRLRELDEIIATSGNANTIAPISDYVGMFTFDVERFMQEYIMYSESVQGCRVVVQYKNEQSSGLIEEDIIKSNEPPISFRGN